ncbi:MAG: type II/IV secretion system protein, partial [Pedosphaera parvula]|nr:type II/IV secretion system protein [Pedosphaera parvula]
MALLSSKQVLERAGLARPEQFQAWSKAWRVAAENGSQESLVGFFCREAGLSEEMFLQRLASVLNWPFLDLPRLSVASEIQKRISTKVAFQYTVLPTEVHDGTLQVAVSNPF